MTRQSRIQSSLVIVLALWTLWSLCSVVWLHQDEESLLLDSPSFHRHDGDEFSKKTSRRSKATPSSNTATNETTTVAKSPWASSNISSAGFIHLGKTGGSSMARLLRNGCHSFRPKPCKEFVENETMISKLVRDYFHIPLDTQRISNSSHSIYFLTSREPYERFVSAFVYLHPRNKGIFRRPQSEADRFQKGKAYKCYTSLQAFATYLGDDPFTYTYQPAPFVNSRDCSFLARAIVAGQVQPMEHMYNNYQHMIQWIPQNKPLYMIRQEHLWEDWIDINTHYLGQKEPVVLPKELSRRNVTTDNETPPVTKDVDDQSRNRLCRALEPEYVAYFTLLQRAVNIQPEGVQEAVELGQAQCPKLNMTATLAAGNV